MVPLGVEPRGLTLTDVQQTFPIILNSRKSTNLGSDESPMNTAVSRNISGPVKRKTFGHCALIFSWKSCEAIHMVC